MLLQCRHQSPKTGATGSYDMTVIVRCLCYVYIGGISAMLLEYEIEQSSQYIFSIYFDRHAANQHYSINIILDPISESSVMQMFFHNR